MAATISEPCITLCRVRRMVYPYEVVEQDAFKANNYPPEAHEGVSCVVDTVEPHGSTGQGPPSLDRLCSEEDTIVIENPASEGSVQTFRFGRVFNSSLPQKSSGYASQETVYNTLGTCMLDNLFAGFHTSLMCIGPRGSGKTHTLFGRNTTLSEGPISPTEVRVGSGIVQRLCRDIFLRIDSLEKTSNFLVEVSAVEVRSEEVFDLLSPAESDIVEPCALGQHPKVGTYIHGVTRIACPDRASLVEAIEDARATRAVITANRLTVRRDSHVIYTIALHRRDSDIDDTSPSNSRQDEPGNKSSPDPTNITDFMAKLTITEIAGCGDHSTSLLDARSDRLFGECRLNRSLDALVKCVDVLAENAMLKSNKVKVVPHHSSTLTRLLKNAGGPLGGQCRCFIMACVAPTQIDYADTIETLMMLKRMSRARNKPKAQLDSTGRLSRGFRAHSSILERELAELQSDAPNWADPSLPLPEVDENGVKMTAVAKDKFLVERKTVWDSYRSKCEHLASSIIETQKLLDDALESWSSRLSRSIESKRGIEEWLRTKGALHERASPLNETKENVQKLLPRLVSLHPDDAIAGRQCFFFEKGGRKLFGSTVVSGLEMRKSHCQITRDKALAAATLEAAEKRDSRSKEAPEHFAHQSTIVSDLVLSVSPRAEVRLNGRIVPVDTNTPLRDGDCLVMGIGRMFRVDVPAPGGSTRAIINAEELSSSPSRPVAKQQRRSWRDSSRILLAEELERILVVEKNLIEKTKEDAEHLHRQIEELQAQVAVEKRRLSKAASKRRREAKKSEKKGVSTPEAYSAKRQEDALQRRIDQLELSIQTRAGESKAYDARVAQAQIGSRVLQDSLLHDLLLFRQMQCICPILGSNISFKPFLVPNHSKVAKLALHDANDNMVHNQADVELWFEVSNFRDSSGDKQGSKSPPRRCSRSSRRTSQNSQIMEPATTGPTKAMWNRDRFLLRSHLIIGMHSVFCAAGGDASGGYRGAPSKGAMEVRKRYNAENNPFILGSGSGVHQAIGQAHMYLDSLSYFIEFEEVVAIIDFRGKEVGKLRIQVTPLKLGGVDLLLDEVDERQTQSLRDFVGEEYEFVITIIGARDLPAELCSSVFVAMSLPDLEGISSPAVGEVSLSNAEGIDGGAAPRFFETVRHAHDTIHPSFNAPMKVKAIVTEHMCEALSRDMVEFTIHGARPGSGFSIEQHRAPDFAAQLKKSDPLRHELAETRTELNLLSMSLSATKLGMEEARLEAKEKQARAEELKHELNMMRKGTAADKYRLEANELKEQLEKSTSELAMANARLEEMELRLTKNKSSTCSLQ